MNNFIVYISTDNNRKHFKIGLSSNIFSTVMELQQSNSFIFNQGPSLNRIIYTESFTNPETANKRISELQHFTTMQVERLIRKYNPNWNNLFPQQHQAFNKRDSNHAA
ncbi:GIY-YIG nuclease family protein [Sphingobacterium paramultivorum]|uniref:GIY-YIG nuclease family protein n=1 Tax=Sphingobacterium paramultivorum TaxID=2886510 RepID=A0A7G5DY62_9SPHI|nr:MULTISPECIES: GIY-YIG nuclease family protein [Sphingobacterium]MCS4163405.1 putative endonuclease [Sphingobacterium sp. BIGb0116]QMV66687.1 GIY-YIG nuclease family protein [Sphingobacterium paramultivorum]WSO15510.1 GIY-YIG nuclease family protein [Sphingobacterium paramultivorum]